MAEIKPRSEVQTTGSKLRVTTCGITRLQSLRESLWPSLGSLNPNHRSLKTHKGRTAPDAKHQRCGCVLWNLPLAPWVDCSISRTEPQGVCVCVSTSCFQGHYPSFSNLSYKRFCTEAGGLAHGITTLANEASDVMGSSQRRPDCVPAIFNIH